MTSLTMSEPPEDQRPLVVCDEPQDHDHIVPSLMVSGWAISPAGIRTVSVSIAGRSLGVAEYGFARPDVAADYSAYPASLHSGYRFRLDTVPATIDSDPVELVVTAEDHSGQRISVRRLLQAHTEQPVAETGFSGPDFIIIGAQRAGTTSLYQYLIAHPDIVPAARKELHFFTQHTGRGLAWYGAQFPADRPSHVLTGEATPYYLFHPHAPHRLARCCPATQLIVLLRDPVDRAYSHYQLEVRLGNETLSFEEALAREEERLAGEREKMLADDLYQSFTFQHFSYVARGHYAAQLRAWLEVIPRDRLLALKSEELYAHPSAVVRRVTDFLGVPPVTLVDRAAYNSESYASMRSETRAQLEDYFRHANRELSDLLGSDWSWNRRA